jgi:hypothetical protein
MDESKALTIVSALANGVNPATGELFAADSPYQAPDVIRALFRAVQLLELNVQRRTRARNDGFGNAGKPWSDEEDQRLLAEFDNGRPLAELASLHGRTHGGIQARLERHGRLLPDAARPLGLSRWRNGAARGA